MQYCMNLMVAVCLCVLVGLATPCCCDPLPLGQETLSRPTRPKVFTSPDQLRSYLDQMSDYLAIASRPRFGKRVATSYRPGSAISPAAASPVNYNTFRFQPSSNDIYDMLSQYEE